MKVSYRRDCASARPGPGHRRPCKNYLSPILVICKFGCCSSCHT